MHLALDGANHIKVHKVERPEDKGFWSWLTDIF